MLVVIDTDAAEFRGALKAYRKGGWAEAWVYLKHLGYADLVAQDYADAARHYSQEHDAAAARTSYMWTADRTRYSACPHCEQGNRGQHKRILCEFCGRAYDGRKRRDSRHEEHGKVNHRP